MLVDRQFPKEIEGDLTSRSQAKRVAVRFDSFAEVELDFSGVETIGQAFADELVRVWPFSHPSTQLKITKGTEPILIMLNHVIKRLDLPQPDATVEILAMPLANSRDIRQRLRRDRARNRKPNKSAYKEQL